MLLYCITYVSGYFSVPVCNWNFFAVTKLNRIEVSSQTSTFSLFALILLQRRKRHLIPNCHFIINCNTQKLYCFYSVQFDYGVMNLDFLPFHSFRENYFGVGS
jgi:hypothetical protein